MKRLSMVAIFENLVGPKLFMMLKGWYNWLHIEKNYSPLTIFHYGQDLKNFFTFLQQYWGEQVEIHMFQNLTSTDLRAYLAHRLSHGVSHRSNARGISALRSLNTFLEKRHQILCPALSSLSLPRLKTTLPRPLPVIDALRVTHTHVIENSESWLDTRDEALFTLLYGCGLRVSEALNLNIADISLTSRSLIVQGKGNKERLIPLQPIIKEKIQLYLSKAPHGGNEKNPLFIGLQGERLSAGVAQRQMRRLRSQLGLPDSATPHALRHSFATHLLAAGGNLRMIQELLGHASLTSTQKYTDIETTQLLNIYQSTHPRIHTSKESKIPQSTADREG